MAKWDNISSRGSVQDRRGSRRMLAIGGGGLSLSGLAILLLLNYLGGGDVTDVLTQIAPQTANITENTAEFEGADEYEVFAATVLGSNNDVWVRIFNENNRTYEAPTLVLFRGLTESSCGNASSESGPHYCPVDETIYLDETFFDALQNYFGAGSADVAQAYVIAHEVGHHVQNELGIIAEMNQRAATSPELANQLSIQQELQADCLAGVWAHSLTDQNVLEAGEIQEAIVAAGAVGDDRIQEKTQGRITPETWTHGSSQDRITAFERGYTSGSATSCNL
jgi:predicted metalloprotease